MCSKSSSHGWRFALQRPRRKGDADQGGACGCCYHLFYSAGASTMLKARSERTQRDGAQFAIAVFDSWDALLGFFKKERTGTPSTSDAVLHARTDDPPLTLRSGLLKEMTQLRFTRGAIACTSGPIADELASRLTGGAVNLANALRVWLSSQQA